MTEPRGSNKRDGGPPDAGDAARTTPEDRQAFIPDLFRRALALGLSGIFTTEEAFRRALGDTLPRDWVDFATDQSERTRSEFVNRLAGELARVIESMDLPELARQVLAEHRIEVTAEIRLVAEEEGERAGGGKKPGRGGKSATRVSLVGPRGRTP